MVENIISGIVATLICSISIKIWEKFKNRKKQYTEKNTQELTIRELKLIRKQFFVCLIYLFIVVFVLMFNWYNDVLRTFILTTVFFIFILLWGAFDAIFNPMKQRVSDKEYEFTNQNPNNDK